MNRRMRIGVVGGQKRKTETHLFKQLDSINIDVAWHVEAMTSKAFSTDCDAVVSMVDYVGHGLYAKAKDFASKHSLPFRNISYNWSTSKPTFLELQEKFYGETDMNKVPRANEFMLSTQEVLSKFKCSHLTLKKMIADGKIKEHEVTVGKFRTVHFDDRELKKAFAEFRTPVINYIGEDNVEAALHDDGNDPLKTAVIGVVKHGIEEAGKAIEQTVNEIMNHAKRKLMLCKVENRILTPVTDVESVEDGKMFAELEGKQAEYAVIEIHSKFALRTVVTIQETEW